MATIATYTAQRGLAAPNTPTAPIGNAVNDALQGLGGAVQNVGAVLQERQKTRETFTAENAYRRLQLELQNDLTARAQEITPGGAGFHEQFMTDTFRPKRDAFLASVPDYLKPRFEEILADETGADFADWSINSSTVERDEMYRWSKEEINLTHQQLTNAIALDPDNFSDYMSAGEALIDSSPLPTPEKALLTQGWREMAQLASLDAMLAKDPQGVLRVLGADARNLSPTSQFQILSRAVQWQESTDNPNAVSPKGAVGLMQVMPSTARDIAAALGDENFPTGENDVVVSEYLSNPFVNKRYGEAYLQQQLRQFAGTRNPIETALVAYNAGPGVAQQWVESGYDDSTLSKETRDYKTAILATISSPVAAGDPGKVAFVASDGSGEADLTNVSSDLIARTQQAFSAMGLDQVKVVSAYRDPEHNDAVGGANDSEHTRGNALDINVAGMPLPKRLELIKALSAAGVTGIGVYANTIHADVGGRRAWGPDHSSNSVPAWAQGVIAEHLKGTTPPLLAVSGAYGDLSYANVQRYRAAADNAIAQQQVAANKATAAQKVEVRQAMENEIATIRTTGVPTGRMDDTAVSTILGEDDYLRFVAERDTAQKTYTAVHDIPTLSMEDMIQRVEAYKPAPGAGNFAQQQEIEASVQREVDRVINLRARDPAAAAMAFPAVESAWAALSAQQNPEPNQVQDFVRLMLETQAQVDIAPDARAPIPSSWAVEIGRALARSPVPTGRETMEQLRAEIQVQYNSLRQFFGDYTDEVIVHSLAEYKGIDKVTAESITSFMQAIQAGSDPFRSRGPDPAQAEDMDQVDSLSFWQMGTAGGALRLFGGQPSATPQGNTGLTPEEMLRAQPTEE